MNVTEFRRYFSPRNFRYRELLRIIFQSSFFIQSCLHFSPSSNHNHRPSNHRTVRQLSKKNLERQNTLYDEEQYEQPLDTCSELNYNMNYHNDEYYDSGGYNQQHQNGELYNYDPYGYANNKKTLPQPPMSYSQSVNDGFTHRFDDVTCLNFRR